MPQYSYSATDSQGNQLDGSLDADDMLAAAEQVRRNGYTPVRVELVAEPELASTAALPIGYGVNQAPAFDLTQRIGEYPTGANTLASPLNDYEAESTEEMGRLEPWQRGGPLPQTPSAPTLQGVTPSTTVATQSPTVTKEALESDPTGLFARGREVQRVGGQPGLGKRFLETFILPLRAGSVMKDLAPYYRQFSALINAGLPYFQTLVSLEANTTNGKLKEVTRAGYEHVSHGGRFSDVMAAYPWIFPIMHVEMVRAAEMGGMLEQVLVQLSGYAEHELAMRRLIAGETFYPKLVLLAALMMLGGRFFITGTPAVSLLVLSGMGKNSYGMMEYLTDTVGFGLTLAVPVVIGVIIFRLFLFNVPGVRESYDTFKMAIPGLGNIVKTFAVAKFTRTYAALYRAGFSMQGALRISGDACGNALVRNAAHNAIPQVERGGLVSDALARSGILPPVTINMFRTGETTGSMDEVLDKISDYYEDEGKLKARQAAMLFSVTVLLLVGILVGMAVIRFYSGMGANISGGGGE